VPTIARLRTCKIQVYAGDHAPPHFKIFGPGSNANVSLETLETLEIIAGQADRKALREARAWATRRENRALLRAAWEKLNTRG
jgi:Domain of unknown function (DUF4160)